MRTYSRQTLLFHQHCPPYGRILAGWISYLVFDWPLTYKLHWHVPKNMRGAAPSLHECRRIYCPFLRPLPPVKRKCLPSVASSQSLFSFH